MAWEQGLQNNSVQYWYVHVSAQHVYGNQSLAIVKQTWEINWKWPGGGRIAEDGGNTSYTCTLKAQTHLIR